MNDFHFEMVAEDKWMVLFGEEQVHVNSKEDAELLAHFPVEHDKHPSQRNLVLVQRIIRVCKTYHLYPVVFAVRQLNAWMEKQEKPVTVK